MSEHQRDTSFLRHIILYDDTEERRKLEDRIARVQRDARCVLRAALAAGLFTALALAGFAYGGILHENFPHNDSQLGFRILCQLGLTSLICLLGFAGLLTFYRWKLNRLRDECRHLIQRFLESRHGKPSEADPGEKEKKETGNMSTPSWTC